MKEKETVDYGKGVFRSTECKSPDSPESRVQYDSRTVIASWEGTGEEG